MYVADALSRAFLPEIPVSDEVNDDVEKMIHGLIDHLPMTSEKLAEMKLAFN